MRKIKVIIVDNSISFTKLVQEEIAKDQALEVVAVVSNPYEAVDAIMKYKPDVMTLEINLPKMNGVEFLKQLMPQCPIPTVIVSLNEKSAVDALEMGAVDFVKKPLTVDAAVIKRFVKEELITKIKIGSTAKVSSHKKVTKATDAIRNITKGTKANDKVIVIGASTGGTEAIYQVLKDLNTDIPGIVIVQHMPPNFTKMYADRLNAQCKIVVKEAETGDRVLPGQALLAPGDCHMKLVKMNGGYQVECKPGPKVNGHCPSVDVLFESAANVLQDKAIGVILTGMGSDGAKGMLAMRNAGALTIGQDEATCVVYGMPKSAYEIGAVKYQIPLENIPGKIYSLLSE